MSVRTRAWPSEFDAGTTTFMAGTFMELSEFLAQIGLEQLRDLLTAEDIDMSVLPLLDDGDLKELGLSLGQRKKLIKGLKALDQSGSEPARAPDRTKSNPVQLRRLSVLFCDMVGSTELGEKLNIDEMQTVLQHYYDIATTVAGRHGGYMAASQGDGLVILFGYPRVLDGFAERCILAARDLQISLSETPVILEGHDPFHIVTRIGVASGQAAVGREHSDVSGDHMHLVGPVVNRAARLQTVAHPNASAVDARTRDLTDMSVLYAQSERHALKGLAEPVEVFHVLGLHDSAELVTTSATFVGREAEIKKLSDLWRQAQAGQAATLTISGDTGIGKSALVQSFVETRVAPQARVIKLLCTAMASQSPLRPVANALAALTKVEHARHSLAGLLKHPTPEMTQLAAQFLGIADASHREAAISTSDREAILDLLAGWIVNAPEGPTVVVLENAQWADDSTSDLMVRTAKRARAENAPLLMLAITRDDGGDGQSDADGNQRLTVPPLGRSEADELLNRLVDGLPMPQSVRDNILHHAEGNPLMLETLGHAQAEHQLPEVADAVVVPHTIYESVSKRLDSIQSGRSVIEALAVLGKPASVDLLNDVVNSDALDISRALVALEADGLIVRDASHGQEKYSIRHKAYRDVIYEQIDGRSRKQMHMAAYYALSDKTDLRPETLASHAQSAHDWTNASIHALSAGDAFLKRSALVEAGHYLAIADAALKRLPASSKVSQDRLRAVTGMASVERSRFGIATDKSAELGQQAVELARDIGDMKAELLALNGLYSHALVHADYPRAEEYAKAVLTAAQISQNKTFMMIGTRAIGAVALHRGDQETAVQNLSEALSQYNRDEHLPLAHAHGYDHAEICAALLSMSLWISGDQQRARHFSAFSIDHSRDINHAHSLAQAISFRVMLGALARHGSELTEVGADGIEVAEKYGIRVMRAAARLFPFATQLCLNPDPPSEAELADLMSRVDEFRAVNPFNYGALLATVLAEVHLRAGDIPAADTFLTAGMEHERNTGETWTSSELLRMRARVAAARGDKVAASNLRDEALDVARLTHAATIALRITCDMAEEERSVATMGAVQDALSQMASRDQSWDVRRAENILQGDRDT